MTSARLTHDTFRPAIETELKQVTDNVNKTKILLDTCKSMKEKTVSEHMLALESLKREHELAMATIQASTDASIKQKIAEANAISAAAEQKVKLYEADINDKNAQLTAEITRMKSQIESASRDTGSQIAAKDVEMNTLRGQLTTKEAEYKRNIDELNDTNRKAIDNLRGEMERLRANGTRELQNATVEYEQHKKSLIEDQKSKEDQLNIQIRTLEETKKTLEQQHAHILKDIQIIFDQSVTLKKLTQKIVSDYSPPAGGRIINKKRHTRMQNRYSRQSLRKLQMSRSVIQNKRRNTTKTKNTKNTKKHNLSRTK